jgi:hypothetical protein
MSESRDFFKKKDFSIQAERLELYEGLKRLEDAAEELDPVNAAKVLLDAKGSRIKLLNDMQNSIYAEEKIEIAIEATRKQADNSNVKFFIPTFREVKDEHGRIRLVPTKANTEEMKLIE